ncbi:hypothetical protein [Couchioplanes caeruleus]|uniref:Uncharacterized protein n=1 Tax=Couchioplanes caeruleus TaxID=56438 RepID=A0A3N1GTQ2_9ACTN|nr:hypothetical protein [Couchioplanes caeruleus]ROP33650.1 hypothetical protein EDD30_6676 [Couchioplanes caeruleus]
MLNLQRDIAKAKDTYTGAYEQLKRDQQSYGDFLKSEIETLEERLARSRPTPTRRSRT